MLMETLHDAFRSLRRARGFALLTIGILAIGVGLNDAIFTVVDCVLLRPLGYHDADRIVSVRTRFLQENRVNPRVGGGDYVDVATQVHGLEAAAHYNNWDGAVQVAGQSSIAPLAYVSPRFAEVMGVQPVAGRLFGHEDVKGTEALVSAGFAREHFGSAERAVGQSIRGERSLYTVVGVLPDGFSFPGKSTVWFEQDAQPENLHRSAYNESMVAKRRPGVSLTQLNAELATLSNQLQQSYAEDRYKALEAISLQERVVGRVAPTLHLLMGSVAVILLIVCANITHLQLVRATRQVREVAVRSALGAPRARLAMRALVEAALLSLAGCAGALLLALPALRLLVHLAPAGLPRLTEVALNWHVLLYSLLMSFAVMAATALLPVWRAWHVDQSTVLRQDSARGLESRSAVRLRSAFLVVQVAFTLVLAAMAVLLARQLIAQSREDLGFNMERLYTLDANAVEATPLPEIAPADAPDVKAAKELQQQNSYTLRLQRLDNALNTLRVTPGVTGAEAINGAPLGFGGSDVGYAIQGKHVFAAPYRNLPNADIRPLTPGALQMMGVPLLRGRALNAGDVYKSPHVLLISQSLAQHQFAGEEAIGRQVMCGFDESRWWTIVGIVGDVKSTPGAPADETFYVPIAQHPAVASGVQLLVRTAPGAQLSEEALRQRLAQAHPDIAATATSMAQNLSEVERDLRFKSVLFESFGGVSILLAMLGMYGATAYSVTQRTFEFGLRMALGASREQVVASVLRRSLWIAALGVIAGIALYFGLVHVMQSQIGKLPRDPLAVAAATGGIVVLSLLAAASPARRASTVAPMRALRAE